MSLQLIANIIVLTAIYALVSTGYVLIYRVSRVLNLAHGELMMVGAYILVATAGLFSGDPLLAPAAIDAVRQWKYKPTSLNGVPVEVETVITVVYTLNQ